ncbi:MAG TPA: thioesterase family protein [Mycobacteriales bacterium]|nr:thioesterase family protein [Mycobacteriales bacterium]
MTLERTSGFAAATAVCRRDEPRHDALFAEARYDAVFAEARYDAVLDAGWSIGGKPNGGYLLAVLARAATDAAGRPHPLAVSGHFLRPPSGGPAEVRTELVKAGRTATTVRATLWQDDRPCLDTLVTTGELSGGPVDYAAGTPPVLPPPELCPDRSEVPMRVELLDHVDVRLDPATAPFPAPTGRPLIQGWVRLRDGTDPDALALTLAVDAMPPTVFHLGRLGWAPTVELTFLLRGLPAPGWLSFRAEATFVADGWFDEDVSVWDSTGRLVAQSRQLALAGRA